MTMVIPDLELIVELDQKFEHTCEHSMHVSEGAKHNDTSGLYAVVVFCTGCSPLNVLFCGAYVEWIKEHPWGFVYCHVCKDRSVVRDTYIILDKVS